MKEIDARGLKCPEPVIITKKALEEIEEGQIISVVDNTIAMENLSRLASGLNLKYEIDERDGCYYVTINKTKNNNKESLNEKKDNTVIVIDSNKLGSGNDELGEVLMKSYTYALTEISPLPKTMIFLNSGVKLTTEGSDVLDNIMKLQQAGVEIISCGTCLDFYGLKEKVKVGIVSNMYSIIENMNSATKVITIG